MPAPVRLIVASVIALLFAAPVLAQREPPVNFDDVRVGLPPGRFVDQRDTNQRGANIIKRNTWAPIYVRLKLNREVQGGAKLRIETTDADDLKTTLVVPLIKNLSDRLPGSMIEPSELGYVPYVRCGDRNGQISLTVISDPADGGDPKPISDTYRTNYNNFLQFRDMSTYVVVSLGSRLPGFDLKDEQGNTNANQSGRTSLRNGRVETSAITNVREMPDHWFGYQAADLVVLTTGTAPNDFLDELFDPQASEQFRPRRDALLEWVRRGGKLVISVGSNASKLAPFKLFQDLVPAPLKLDPPTQAMPELKFAWRGLSGAPDRETLRPKNEGGTFPVARLALNPAHPPRVLIESSRDPALNDKPDLPIVVQSAYGLGRITLVALDLDQSPFIDSQKKADFWDWLIREAGSARAAQGTNRNTNTYYGGGDTEDEFTAALRTHVDTFDGVPVISFGWVALFIILYTLLIGPVEYLFLKKVLGRLELTWVTFPLIVVTVSAAAYFTAYAIKGKDLKVNKVDVVDVDLVGGRVYGRTWFTIFSPRIDSYTIAVEPRDGWAVAAPAPVPPNQATLVDWMGGGRGGSKSIISRGYAYNTDENGRVLADGLDRVPIQVWSTKAFTASWTAPADPGTPLIAADLYHPPADPNALAGSFINNLPVSALQEPVLFYRGTAYKLPPLTPGRAVDVIAAGRAAGGLPPDNDWLGRNVTLPAANQPNYNPGFGRSANAVPTTSNLSLWGALFHEKALGRGVGTLQNASLRELDQSWRLNDEYRDEAILIARISESGLAEQLMADPTGPSVTKLWLKGLPGNPAGRQPVPGTLRQETYIRVYIPVKPKPGQK